MQETWFIRHRPRSAVFREQIFVPCIPMGQRTRASLGVRHDSSHRGGETNTHDDMSPLMKTMSVAIAPNQVDISRIYHSYVNICSPARHGGDCLTAR
jgi:hypothetical protein